MTAATPFDRVRAIRVALLCVATIRLPAVLLLMLVASAGVPVEPCGAETPSSPSVWRPRSVAPFAMLGGVLAIELEPTAPPEAWTRTALLRLEDGAEIQAAVGVVVPAERPLVPRWTTPADPIRVVSIDEYRTMLASSTAPIDAVFVALAPMEREYEGFVTLSGTMVRPRWLPPPNGARPEVVPVESAPEHAARLDLAARDHRPDPASPGEWWRWALLADALDAVTPEPPFEGPARLYALHRAELWRAGLARVRRASASVAQELLELLTAMVEDPDRPDGDRSIAAWISQPAELTSLLAILLDPNRSTEATMRAALGWMQSRTPLTVWLESDAGESVVVAAANPLPEEVVVRCSWVEAAREPPVALLVPSRTVARLRIERPPGAPRTRVDHPREEPEERWRSGLTLRFESRGWDGRVAVAPGRFPVRPPGLALAAFVPALTLAAAQSQRIELPPPEWRTTASLRRLGRRWELFLECLRPRPSQGDRVEVSIGSATQGGVFTVDEQGSISMLVGTAPADLAAHARVHADRWRVRIELPDAWVPPAMLGAPERPLELSISRSPGPGLGRQTAALAVPSWRPPAVIQADLGAWIDLPAPTDP